MTATSSADSRPDDDDQTVHTFQYGTGRMPFFMKIVWLLFLAFGAYYVVVFLLDALGSDLGA